MPEEIYLVDRLVIALEGAVKREPAAEGDRLTFNLSFKNPIGSPGSTARPPGMELWDGLGRTYEPSNADWAEPIEPDTRISRMVEFQIPVDATGLQLVFAPGQPEEVHADLNPAA